MQVLPVEYERIESNTQLRKQRETELNNKKSTSVLEVHG